MRVVGIDFGNDKCIISAIRNGQLETVTNDFNERKTPSMVAFSNRKREIGDAARKQWATNTEHTIFDFKNMLDLQFKKKRLFDVLVTNKNSEDATLCFDIIFNNQTLQLNPVQILIMLFAKIKGDVNVFLHPDKVTGCVLAVPSYFNERERSGLLLAAGIAGFDCNFLIKETTAVAINYSFYKKFQTPINVMFVDFGHSSIQIFACKFSEKQLEIVAEVSKLIGGRDIDELLTDHIIKTLKIPTAKGKNRVFRVQLLQEVENVKMKMTSNTDDLPLNLGHLLNNEHISVSMNRATMKEICSSMFSDIELLLYQCLKEANLKIDEIHSIEMVGGSSRVPAINELVEKVFGQAPTTTMNPDEAISRGCLLRSIVSVRRRGFKINERPFIDKIKSSIYENDANVRVYQVHKNLKCPATDTLDATEHQVKEYMKIENNLSKSNVEEVHRQNARNKLDAFLSEKLKESSGELASNDPQKLKQLNELRLWDDGTKEQYQESLAEWIRYFKELKHKIAYEERQVDANSLPTDSHTDLHSLITLKEPMLNNNQISIKKPRLDVNVASTSKQRDNVLSKVKTEAIQQRKDYVQCQKEPRLQILPSQEVQRKPVGHPFFLTCRPDVPDSNLITDLQWRDNLNMRVLPKPSGQSSPPMYTEVLPGDQSLALMITSLTEGMAGTYYCSASYANNVPLEISVRIETYVAITWKNAAENQFPTAGKTDTIHCEVTANPAPTVDWLRNGDSIKSGGRYVVEARGLLIRDIDQNDDGIYTCRAAVIQTGELVERSIRVEVQIPPKIEALPKELEAIEEKQFSVQCNASGKPVPEYTWIKDHSQVNVAGAERFLVNPLTGQMSITRVTHEDYGTYTCIAKNRAGQDQSTTLINVLIRPRIYELLNITIAETKEGALICKATGRPAPEITFRRWGTQEEFVQGTQPDDDRIVLEQQANDQKGESTGTLRIYKMMKTDDGLYECVARNKGESAYKVGHITVEYKPSFEHMQGLPPVFSWEERRANLSCLAQGIPNATIEWRWNDRLIKDINDPNLQVEGNGPRSDLLVTPRDRRYYSAYKCIASNRLGRVDHTMVLREARIPDVVVSATPRIVTATTMTFDIIGPAFEVGLPILTYSVQYKELIQPDWTYAFNKTWTAANEKTTDSVYTIEGLKPQTAYTFRFSARNLVGLGPWGAYKQQSTPVRSVPEPPRILHATDKNVDANDDEQIIVSPYSDHFDLTWQVAADNGEPINFYQVKYCPGLKVDGEWTEIGQLCETQTVPITVTNDFKMNNLKGDTYYQIEVRAHNAIGFSQPSSLLMRTARGSDLVIRVDSPALSSAAIIGIAIGGVLLLIILIDFLCCLIVNAGIMAALCRRTKRSPSELDDESKIGSGQLVKEPPPSPSPLPPRVRLGGSPLTTPLEEKEPLNTPCGSMKNSSVEFDGRVVHSRSGEIIGKNSSV